MYFTDRGIEELAGRRGEEEGGQDGGRGEAEEGATSHEGSPCPQVRGAAFIGRPGLPGSPQFAARLARGGEAPGGREKKGANRNLRVGSRDPVAIRDSQQPIGGSRGEGNR